MLPSLAVAISAAAISLGAAALAACGPSAAPAAAAPGPAERVLRRAYVLHFAGARIGYALERERVIAADRPRRELVRREFVRVRRAPSVASYETALVLRGAADGDADELDVTVRHCEAESLAQLPAPSLAAPLDHPCPAGAHSGALTAHATARRSGGQWQVDSTLWTSAKRLPLAAQPAEWLDTRPDDELRDQLVFLATRGFALGRAERRWLDERTWLGRISLPGADLTATTVLDADRRPRLVLEESGGAATRIAEDLISFDALDLADLVALTSIDVRGRPPPPGQPRRIAVSLPGLATGEATAPPAEAPGQRAASAGPLLHLELLPQPARAEDAAAVAAIADLARQVLPGHRGGDCTAYALRYAALAAARRIPTRLVTGFALDESASSLLVRHRWAVSWTGARWISVDPSAPAEEVAPAGPRLFALAIHDATPEALAAAESAFTGWRDVDAQWER